MRVLSVIPSVAPRIGGPATSLLAAIHPLAREGIDTTIFATDLARAASARGGQRISLTELQRQAAVRSESVRLFRTRRPYRAAFSPEMARALHGTERFDLVRIHSLFLFPQYAAWRYCRRTSTPYIVSIHGALDPYLRERGRLKKRLVSWTWQDEMLRCASAVHVATEAEAASVAEVFPGLPLVTVPNGIEMACFEHIPSGSDFRARFLGGHEGPVVLFLGRITFKKGLDLLLDAFAMVTRDAPDARLAVVGPDDEDLWPSLELQARKLGLSRSVTFVGPLYGRERLDALGAATAWVLPSHTENFGNAVVEAMAARVPVIISPGVNLATEIAKHEAGLIAPRTSSALRVEILRLLRDSCLRDTLSNRGREFARNYDWSVVGPQLAEAYRLAADRGSHYSRRDRNWARSTSPDCVDL